MAYLSFIANRPQQQSAPKPTTPAPTSDAPKPEALKDISKTLSQGDLAKVKEVGERLHKATAHMRESAPSPTAGDGGNAALLQKQNNQDKTQAALSPTDKFKGQTAPPKRAGGWER